jgi:hypothetical protein
MINQTARTFSDFVNFIEAIPLFAGFCVFRGQATKQNLLPSIARKNPEADTVDLEPLTKPCHREATAARLAMHE